MTAEEANMYKAELQRKENSARLISECLVTLERFCYSMPLDWLLGKEEFVAAFLYLLREPSAGIQIKAAACLEQLAMRKLESYYVASAHIAACLSRSVKRTR